MRQWIAAIDRHSSELRHLRFRTLATEDGHYSLEFTIHQMADFDEIVSDSDKLMRLEQGQIVELGSLMTAATEHYRTGQVLVESSHASYDLLGLSCEGMPLLRRERFFVTPAKSGEFERVMRSLVKLARDRRSPLGFRTRIFLYGPEVPCFEIETCAPDEGALARKQEQAARLLGREGDELSAQMTALARRMEELRLWRRPDLSPANG